jgi:sulfate/thiosulfate-binding protein
MKASMTATVFGALLLWLLGCGSDSGSGAVQLTNASYDPTRELYLEINEAFIKDYKANKKADIIIVQSHGGSGAQARAVIDGLPADVVTLALASDIEAIGAKGLIADGWQARLPNNASPYTSTVVLVTRAGNPKNIKDWGDLVQSGIKVVTPNPKTSGGARWNFLAAWGYVTIHKKGTEAEAEEFVRKLYKNVPKLDLGARGSTVTFVKDTTNDVAILWENEAFLLQKENPKEKFEVIYPSASILAEPPVSVVDRVVDKRGTRAAAEEYLQFLYTETAQRIIGKNGYRPKDAANLKKYAETLPELPLFSVRDVAGSWKEAQAKFFADGGVFDQIYQPKGK